MILMSFIGNIPNKLKIRNSVLIAILGRLHCSSLMREN